MHLYRPCILSRGVREGGEERGSEGEGEWAGGRGIEGRIQYSPQQGSELKQVVLAVYSEQKSKRERGEGGGRGGGGEGRGQVDKGYRKVPVLTPAGLWASAGCIGRAF